MKLRYPTGIVLFLAGFFGTWGGYLEDWPAVALMVLGALTVVGAHVYDGISAGPVEVDADEGEKGGAP